MTASFNIPEEATFYGFVTSGLGAHSSRTIMLFELQLLLAGSSPTATSDEYRRLIQDDNILLKQTASTRMHSFRTLRELYGLSPEWTLFQALRDLWVNIEAQPQIAMLAALARDPSLRSSAEVIFAAPTGERVTSQDIAQSVQTMFSDLNDTTLAKIGRNAGSSWTQSGHLTGHTNKVRTRLQSHPASVAYALLLGYLCGERGDGLFQTDWTRVLDAPLHMLHNQAQAASRYGWLEYRRSGSITDISFHHFLRKKGL